MLSKMRKSLSDFFQRNRRGIGTEIEIHEVIAMLAPELSKGDGASQAWTRAKRTSEEATCHRLDSRDAAEAEPGKIITVA